MRNRQAAELRSDRELRRVVGREERERLPSGGSGRKVEVDRDGVRRSGRDVRRRGADRVGTRRVCV